MFNRIKKIENEVIDLKNQLYENLDNQKIEKMSKKYKVKIKFENIGLFCTSHILILNDITASTSIIANKHEYIQSNEFERDIKAFLYNKNKEEK